MGASYDPPRANLEFSQDQELPFALLSDVDGTAAAAYGVRRAPGSRWERVPERRTFVIDPSGIVRRVYDVTDVYAHPGQVLDDLRLLQAAPGPS